MKQAQAALVDAQRALDVALGALAAPKEPDLDRLRTWFGAVSSADAAKVGKILTSARGFATGISFRCSISTNAKIGDVFAYVRPDQSFAIVLGAFFFDAAESGFDSKLGTIVHEMTHFVLAGATKDAAYGVAGARKLAVSKPAVAQANADNYEYFVEATLFNLK